MSGKGLKTRGNRDLGVEMDHLLLISWFTHFMFHKMTVSQLDSLFMRIKVNDAGFEIVSNIIKSMGYIFCRRLAS